MEFDMKIFVHKSNYNSSPKLGEVALGRRSV